MSSRRGGPYHQQKHVVVWTLCVVSAIYISLTMAFASRLQSVGADRPRHQRLLLKVATSGSESRDSASVLPSFEARAGAGVTTTYVRVPNNLSAAARSPQMSTHCIQDWSVPAATTVTDDDAQRWASREKPYGGCELKDGQCRYAGGCSNYDVHEYAFVDSSALGSCGSHDHLDVRPAAPGTDCVNKTFIPLHLPELFFFGHLDTLMTKLVRIIARGDHRDALLYVPYHWSFSERVVALLDLMGIGYVTEFPEGKCFARVVWVCHSVSFDPVAARNTSVALRAAVARTAAPTGRSRCKNVYFMRTLGSSRNGRLVANEEGFARYLRDHHGFCIMTGGETLSALAYVVGHADLIAGTHGGALMNLVFLDPARRPAVIELEGYGKYAKYWLLATGMGHRYGWMSFDPNVGIDQGRFLQLMKQLLVQQRSLHRKSTPPPPQRTYLDRVESMYADD